MHPSAKSLRVRRLILWLFVVVLVPVFGRAQSTAFFPQSVASGDPRPDSVVLWTRVLDVAQPGVDLPVTL